MVLSLWKVRGLVLLTALLFATVALAGCHDLPNSFSDGIESAQDPDDAQDADGDGDPGDGEGTDTDGGGDEGDEGEGKDNDEGDGGDGDDEGDEEDEEDENNNGEGNGDDNETDEDGPIVEEGDFEEDHVVTIQEDLVSTNCAEDDFDPQTLEIDVGEVVRWSNEGGCGHTATSGDAWDEHDDLFDTGNIGSGEESEFSFRFNETGTYNYYCKFHPGMELGEIVVS